jgi:hypothetical protein
MHGAYNFKMETLAFSDNSFNMCVITLSA